MSPQQPARCHALRPDPLYGPSGRSATASPQRQQDPAAGLIHGETGNSSTSGSGTHCRTPPILSPGEFGKESIHKLNGFSKALIRFGDSLPRPPLYRRPKCGPLPSLVGRRWHGFSLRARAGPGALPAAGTAAAGGARPRPDRRPGPGPRPRSPGLRRPLPEPRRERLAAAAAGRRRPKERARGGAARRREGACVLSGLCAPAAAAAGQPRCARAARARLPGASPRPAEFPLLCPLPPRWAPLRRVRARLGLLQAGQTQSLTPPARASPGWLGSPAGRLSFASWGAPQVRGLAGEVLVDAASLQHQRLNVNFA